MGNAVAIDMVLRKVNGLPLEVTTLSLPECKALFPAWNDALQERFQAAQQHGSVTRGVLVRQLMRQKDVEDGVDRPAKTASLAVLRRRKAKAATTSKDQELRVGPDGEPHIRMDFLTLLGDREGQRVWSAAEPYKRSPPKVRQLTPGARFHHKALPKESHTPWHQTPASASQLAAFDRLAHDNRLLESLVRDGGATI